MPRFDPDFLWNLVALANFMRLSLLKAAHAAVGECPIAGNPGSLTDHSRWKNPGCPGELRLRYKHDSAFFLASPGFFHFAQGHRVNVYREPHPGSGGKHGG